LLIFVPWILILKIYNKIPAFRDDIGIAKEIKWVMIGYFLMGVFFIGLFTAVSVLLSLSGNTDVVFAILCHFAYHLVALSAFCTSMMMTWWPLQQYMVHEDTMEHYKGGRIEPTAMMQTKSNSVDTTAPSTTEVDAATVSIQEVCLTMFGMDLLMKFLEGEYSRENLLFIIEVTLLQRSIHEHIGNNQRQYAKQNIDLSEVYFFRLPSTCPKSTLVEAEYEAEIQKYGEQQSNGRILTFIAREHIRYKCIMFQLYTKYIARGSELSVNISSMQRAKLHRLCHREAEWMSNAKYDDISKLLTLFEHAKNEAIALIKSDSLPRFKRTEAFQRIIEMLEKVQKQAREMQIASSPKSSKRDLVKDESVTETLES